MNTRNHNREFQHPDDGWYQIEALGNHPNRAAGVVQVIDQAAAAAIVNRFNQDAAAGQLRQGNELLIDHEHFSDQPDQETRAYGWLQELQDREDGIYGRIRWTSTGKAAVDGGDYRFFSTEYAPEDLQPVTDAAHNRAGSPKVVRPTRLAGLSLTNMNNNRGQKPITNREALADASASAVNQKNNNQVTNRKLMKNIATKLGLAAEASEDAILEGVTKIMNRVTELEPLVAENTTLKNRVAEIDAANVDALLAEHGVKEAKVLNRVKPILLATPAADRPAWLADCGFQRGGNAPAAETVTAGRVLNRGGGAAALGKADSLAGADEKGLAQKIKNRAQELHVNGRSFDSAWQQAVREVIKN